MHQIQYNPIVYLVPRPLLRTRRAATTRYAVGKTERGTCARTEFECCRQSIFKPYNKFFQKHYVKSVYFKKTVARILILLKLWYFLFWFVLKVPQFWMNRDSRNCLLKMNGLYVSKILSEALRNSYIDLAKICWHIPLVIYLDTFYLWQFYVQ